MWNSARILRATTALAIAMLHLVSPAPVQSTTPTRTGSDGFVVTDAHRIAIEGVRVVPGDGAPALEDQTVLLRDGRIDRIGAAIDLPDDSYVIDGRGKTLLPGLVMLHEHLFYPTDKGQAGHYGDLQPVAFPRLYLAHGVTTIRTGGSFEPLNELQIKRGIEEGRLIGPDLDITGPYLEGPGSFLEQAAPIESPDEARRIVSFWADQGVTSFKAYNFLSREVLAAAIDEVHRRGLKITGHLCSVTFAEAAAMGIDNLEHGLNSAMDFQEGREPDRCKLHDVAAYMLAMNVDSPGVQKLIEVLVEADVAITSTLAVLADFGTRTDRPGEAALAVLADGARQRYLTTKKHVASSRNDDALEVEMAFQRAFVDAGGLLLSGTDPTGIGGTIAGFASLWQVELLVDAGFTPLEAIKISTYNGALYLDRLDEIGSVAEGKRADLILVRGRPDTTIGDLRNIEIVFKRGIGYNPRALVESAAGRVGR